MIWELRKGLLLKVVNFYADDITKPGVSQATGFLWTGSPFVLPVSGFQNCVYLGPLQNFTKFTTKIQYVVGLTSNQFVGFKS